MENHFSKIPFGLGEGYVLSVPVFCLGLKCGQAVSLGFKLVK
jgi:hypothetical protein